MGWSAKKAARDRKHEAIQNSGTLGISDWKLMRWLTQFQMDPCRVFDIGLWIGNPTAYDLALLLRYILDNGDDKVETLKEEISELQADKDNLEEEKNDLSDEYDKLKKAANHIEDKLFAMRKVVEELLENTGDEDEIDRKAIREKLYDINEKIEEALDE